MARSKKKKDPIYATAGLGDNLIRMSWRNNIPFDKLKQLNPDVKGPGYVLKMGQKVRLT